MGLDDYLTFEAFDSAVSRATGNATGALDDRADGALLVFPEHLGFLLSTVPFGVIGVVLCFDGYHDGPIAHLDAQGATLVAQPIHFPNPGYRYDGTGSKVPAHEDFGHLLQGRENIRIGVSAALVGETFRDRRAEGVSHIVANRGNPDADWSDIVLAEAPDPVAPATVSAIVEP